MAAAIASFSNFQRQRFQPFVSTNPQALQRVVRHIVRHGVISLDSLQVRPIDLIFKLKCILDCMVLIFQELHVLG